MEKTISIYWFVILAIIATALVIMTAAFYNAPYDVRGIEARVLANNIADCISKNGQIEDYVYQDSFNEEFKDNLLDICNISFNAEESFEEIQYYAKVEFFDSALNSLFEIEKGNLNFISSCAIQDSEKFKKLAQCQESRFYSTSEESQFLIKITTAVGKTIKNAK